MLYAAIIAGTAVLAAFGAVMYRSGRHAAENKALRARERENEKVDKIINSNAGLGRGECLERLRGGQDKK